VANAGAPVVVLAAMLMSIAEFVEFQKLGPDELRARLGLPSACDPAVTALTTEPAANSVTVAVECRAKPDESKPEPRRPPAPAKRGS